MNQQYLDIWFDRVADLAGYKTEGEGVASSVIAGLGHLNLFIGPNNAGKSRFMRALFGQVAFDCLPSDFPIQALRERLRAVQAQVEARLGKRIVQIDGFGRDTVKSLAQEDNNVIRNGDNRWKEVSEKLDLFFKKEGPYSPAFSGSFGPPSQYEVDAIARDIKQPVAEFLELFRAHKIQLGDEPHTYIPILRGLREFERGGTPYVDRTRKDYGSSWGGRGDFFTGEGLYSRLKELLLGERAKRVLVRDYESFLSEEFFQGRDVALVPRQDSDVVHLVIGNDEDIPIYNLGDGLQSIIILTFPVFTSEERRLFFIEEPEVHLHPGMQRRLIEVLRSDRFKKHQFFLTTHSNHLLDVVAEDPGASVYLFRNKEGLRSFTITRIQQKDRGVLQSLGARSSAMYLTNAVVWVEGITDRLYLRAFLRRYMADLALVLKEDTHYVFAEVGGACVVHWNFDEDGEALAKEIKTARICGDNFLVLDGDNATKGRRKETFTAQLGDRFHLLQAKEIENLLPVEAVKAAVGKLWPNVERNALEKIKSEEYQSSPNGLGHYLDQLFPVTGLGEKSGTVSRKMDFCHAAIEEMGKSSSWPLAADVESLCKKLVEFICRANQISPEE